MKMKYDSEADAAYLYIMDENIKVIKTYTCDVDSKGGMINLDLDESGHLVGIEILSASRRLPKELLV